MTGSAFTDDDIDLFAQTLFAGFHADAARFTASEGQARWEGQSDLAKGNWRRAARALLRHLTGRTGVVADQATAKPCPFCGGHEITVEPDEYGSGGQWVPPIHIVCCGCGVSVCAGSEPEALTQWNTRA